MTLSPMHILTTAELMDINDKEAEDVSEHDISLMIFTIAELLDRFNRAANKVTEARMILAGRSHTGGE
jgi:hypothetical protein